MKPLIILYYVVLITADTIFGLFISIITGSFLIGIGVGFVLSIGIGVLGGELEFKEERKALHKKYYSGNRPKEPDNIINFPPQ